MLPRVRKFNQDFFGRMVLSGLTKGNHNLHREISMWFMADIDAIIDKRSSNSWHRLTSHRYCIQPILQSWFCQIARCSTPKRVVEGNKVIMLSRNWSPFRELSL
jgi:hypothetical protein